MVLIQILIKCQLLLVLLALQNVGNKNAMALRVTKNGSEMPVSKLPHITNIHLAGVGGGLEYIQGSRTWDTSRFATTTDLPLTLRFTDHLNVEWAVTIDNTWEQVTFAVPCGTEIIWYGDESSRTGSDAQTNFASLTFGYKESSWFHSHGIRIRFNGYKYANFGEAMLDSIQWSSILDNLATGTESITNVAEAISAIGGLAG